MKKAIVLLALMAGFLSNAQNKFQAGIHYLPSLDDYPMRENGIGLDLRLRVVSLGPVSLHAALSGTYEASKIDYLSDAVVLNPAAYAELSLPGIPLKPYLGVGYVYYRIKADEADFVNSGDFDPFIYGGYDETVDFNGFNINPGARIHFAKILYADLGYNFVSGNGSGASYSKNKTERNQIKIGFGVRF